MDGRISPDSSHGWAAAFADVAGRAIEAFGKPLLATKEPHVNYVGDDVDPEMLRQIEWLSLPDEQVVAHPEADQVRAFRSALEPWHEAQLREAAFWRWVAYEGYAGEDPRVFPLRQRLFMLETLRTTGWPLESFRGESAVEIGCGPLGMIECVPAARRTAFDPLNAVYSQLFSKVRSPAIDYVDTLAPWATERRGTYDFGICFNVLDHTADARESFDGFFDLIRPGGRFLLQVNLLEDRQPASEEHRRMHPSPFTRERIESWLAERSAGHDTDVGETISADNERWFMAWGRTRS